MIKFIQNIGDYFSSNYFDEDFPSKVFSKSGYSADDIKEFNKKLSPLKDKFFKFKKLFIEGRLRTRDKVFETHKFNTEILNALGYDANPTQYDQLFHFSEEEAIPVRHYLYRGDQLHLLIMEMQALIKEDDNDPDGLFEQRYNVEEEELKSPPQKYHRSQWQEVFKVPDGVKISPAVINTAISQLFLLEPHQRPKYILLLGGNVIFLLEQEKWFRGSYLQFDLEELFSEATANRAANYYSLLNFLIGKEALAPESNMVLLDQLDEDSHKSAYEVTKDLKEGIIYAVEALANEALYYQKNILQEVFDETDDQFEQEIKDDSLRIIYRLLFIFYAESREDLDILPSDDTVYNKGYSLEMLRDLEQVPLYSETSLNGYFFHESLNKLFEVLGSGYRENENGNNKSFRVRHIDSPFFDNNRLKHLHKVKFRNKVWQEIICRLSLSKQQRNKTRGRISYSNLGINQLGSVYESLLAYRGFYAEQDYIEVHKKGKPEEGTYLVPRSRRDDFEEDEILKDENYQDVIIKKGMFVYRLSGRDRQKSASYYTPEVLTQCTVKYTLKPILEKLDKGEIKALDLLDLKLLEPAMGAAAFHNEMINQLADAYVSYRQKEIRDSGRKEWRIEPDKYKEELQKVKAYIATHNVYGVDLNPTAIELGKLSLWLNVIHKDMETPFFSNRICVGNAVVGAWLKVYAEKELSEEYEVVRNAKGKDKRTLIKKEWWEKAPRQIEFKPNTNYEKLKTDRKPNEIYHFLFPDKYMVPSAGIKLLKEENSKFSKAVTEWKKEWTAPLSKSELEKLKAISSKVDELLTEYYQFQRKINLQTGSRQNIFGATRNSEQTSLKLRTYDEKEKLADQRNRHSAPYFKLKMVMDYWCSLWFWDVRQADELPNRRQYWNDIASILDLDIDKIASEEKAAKSFQEGAQLALLHVEGKQLTIGEETNTVSNTFLEAVVEYAERKDLFDNNERLAIVSQLASKYYFFHPQLEFLEVFWERGGFDLISGNPPWISLSLDDKEFVGEYKPEVFIRKTSAAKSRRLLTTIISDEHNRKCYIEEDITNTASQTFLSASANYELLKGQRNNLYKNVLFNSLHLINSNGYFGLIYPETLYDDPDSGRFRSIIYRHLIQHFHFINQLLLFSEIDNQVSYSINIFRGTDSTIEFDAIFNLFHPKSIQLCYTQTSSIDLSLKIKGQNNTYSWNLLGCTDRVIQFDDLLLKRIAEIVEFDSKIFFQTTLLRLHAKSILEVYSKVKSLPKKVLNYTNYITDGLNDTSAFDELILTREFVSNPDIQNFELIIAGPNFFVCTPWYKSIRTSMKSNRDYDYVYPASINDIYTPNSSSKANNLNQVRSFYSNCIEEGDSWLNYYRVVFSKMLNLGSMRTLQPSIMPPSIPHVSNVISVLFGNERKLIELTSLTASIVYDFYIKSLGKENLYPETIQSLRIGIPEKYYNDLCLRVLRLNCMTKHFSQIWEKNFHPSFVNISWSKVDKRLSQNSSLTPKYDFQTAPLKNEYERRLALVEIDCLVAMSIGLNLEDLINIYKIYFPVSQQYEDSTFYDSNGEIVFTTNKGLPDVGVEKSIWNNIYNYNQGESHEHTILKSEQYYEKKVTYYAPFEKCDRVEDYKIAWKHFEQIFKDK